MKVAETDITVISEDFKTDKTAYIFENKIFYNNEIWNRSNTFIQILLKHGIFLEKGQYH